MKSELKTKRLELRLSERDFKLFKLSAYSIGYTPSKLLRMFIACSIYEFQKKVNLGEISCEDYETFFDNQL